ncbi:hypothetical protein GCM10023164_28910 [Christiangramia aestuarii]
MLVTILFLVALFYAANFKSEKSELKFEDLILVIFTGIGALVTYWLNVSLDIGVVLAAGITGLFSSFLPFINRRSDILRELPVAVYCGAFAGMTSPLVAGGYGFIMAAGLFSGLLLVISKSTLNGFGGKLGSIAFGGVCLVSLLIYLAS